MYYVEYNEFERTLFFKQRINQRRELAWGN